MIQHALQVASEFRSSSIHTGGKANREDGKMKVYLSNIGPDTQASSTSGLYSLRDTCSLSFQNSTQL